MSAMGGMPMPGGWTMSMAWMRMPGQSWVDAAAMFLGMWVVMMVAMMLPSLVPMLWRYRQAVATTGETRLGRLTVLVSIGYFFVWTVIGAVVFSVGAAVSADRNEPASSGARGADRGRRRRAGRRLAPIHEWKLRHLACCRPALDRARTLANDAATAYRYGVRLGLHCAKCCGGLIAILLVVGVMDLVAMAVVAAAITVERVLPAGERVARIMGVVIIATGLLLIART